MNNADFEIKDGILYEYQGNGGHAVVPEGVTEIDGEAFDNHNAIKVLELPSTLKNIDSWLVYGCDVLEDIIVSEDNPYMVKMDGCIYSKDMTELLLFPTYMDQELFVLPDSVKVIGRTAFYRTDIKKVVCGKGLEKISEEAFLSCKKLEDIQLSDSLKEIGKDAFAACESLKSLVLPGGVKIIL